MDNRNIPSTLSWLCKGNISTNPDRVSSAFTSTECCIKRTSSDMILPLELFFAF